LNLLQVAVRQGPQFAEELGQLGAVGLLIELFADKDNPMTSRQLCASVLAGLCSDNASNCREFRKKDGVEAIRAEVLYRPDETTDNHLFYTLCVIDCVWCAVVATRKNEIRFLDAGGLFAMLDVLEVAPLLLKRQLIGCLADLMQYRKAAKLFVQWNSQVTMKGGLKILLELWQSEQDASGSTGRDGVIRNLARPLNPQAPPEGEVAGGGADDRPDSRSSDGSARSGSKASMKIRHARNFADVAATSRMSQTSRSFMGGQRGNTAAATGAATAGPGKLTAALGAGGVAKGDVGANLLERQDSRAKIYAVLRCVGFECQEALTIAERQQMELVKLYPTAAELETWIEVQENLEARCVKPIAADLKWIEDSINERQDNAAKVQGVQRKLADELRDEEQASLNRFYEDIRGRAQFRRTSNGKDDGEGAPPSLPSRGDPDGMSSGDGF